MADPASHSRGVPADTPEVAEFVALLAHDLNNLLSVIIGSAGLLRSEYPERALDAAATPMATSI